MLSGPIGSQVASSLGASSGGSAFYSTLFSFSGNEEEMGAGSHWEAWGRPTPSLPGSFSPPMLLF